MRLLDTLRFALAGGALALAAGPAVAQDGQPPSGAPVTNPNTNELRPRVRTATPPIERSDQVLPGVPATADDPAPTGTRPVPARNPTAPSGLPPAAPGDVIPVPPAGGVRGHVPGPGAGAARDRRIHIIEGVVTRISPPERTNPGELIRITVDPNQDWQSYVAEGPHGVRPVTRPDDADEPTRRGIERPAAGGDRDTPAPARPRDLTPRDRGANRSPRSSADDPATPTDEPRGGFRNLPPAQDPTQAPATDRPAASRAEEAATGRVQAENPAPTPSDLAAPAPAGAAAPVADDAAANPDFKPPVDLVVTRFSRVVTFARSRDGVDMLGAQTASSPDRHSNRSGQVGGAEAPPAGPQETNFTNIREGSYVAARYRAVGDRNEIINLSLIEFPLVDPSEAAPHRTAPPAGAAPGIGSAGRVGTAPAPGPRPVEGINAPRIPRVPTDPIGPSIPR